jgi:hypothetical protein
MRKTTLIAMVCLATINFFASCSKEAETSTTNTTLSAKTLKLVDKNWYITAIKMNPGIPDGNGGMLTDYFGLLDSCDRDDYYVFKADGTLKLYPGVLKCNPSDTFLFPSVWSFTNNENSIKVNGSTSNIVSFEDKMFKLESSTVSNGVVQTQTTTYENK